ncbi:hypothetical protein [Kitasatospora sp. NPDC092286]|uniref:hypothetical protein n=1 Tax=Kitasatospora sp. NPDC092286 TaxID=3364087 RepID=UPI0037F267B1
MFSDEFSEASRHSGLVVEVVPGEVHVQQVFDRLGHLRDLDLVGQVTSALDKVDELAGEDGLGLVGVGQEAREAGANPEPGVLRERFVSV